jgi:hypothetical protein
MPWTPPSGFTSEEFDAYAKAHYNAARRASYARHPDRVMRQRLVSAVNLLSRHGLIDNQLKQTITNSIKAVADNE